MTQLDHSQHSFLFTAVAMLGIIQLAHGSVQAQSEENSRPLIAYVGTFSAPVRDMLPTQVDLPPGTGQGIHLFKVNRDTGEMTAAGI